MVRPLSSFFRIKISLYTYRWKQIFSHHVSSSVIFGVITYLCLNTWVYLIISILWWQWTEQDNVIQLPNTDCMKVLLKFFPLLLRTWIENQCLLLKYFIPFYHFPHKKPWDHKNLAGCKQGKGSGLRTQILELSISWTCPGYPEIKGCCLQNWKFKMSSFFLSSLYPF